MEVRFVERGIVQIDDARIVFRNFTGVGSKYNREGDKNFALIIPNEEIANALITEGYNVRIKPPREEGYGPFMFLPIKIKFNDRGPNVYLETGKKRTKLDEQTIACLDNIESSSISLDIRGFDWTNNRGENGRTAYLQSMLFVQRITDRFAQYDEDNDLPFDD